MTSPTMRRGLAASALHAAWSVTMGAGDPEKQLAEARVLADGLTQR